MDRDSMDMSLMHTNGLDASVYMMACRTVRRIEVASIEVDLVAMVALEMLAAALEMLVGSFVAAAAVGSVAMVDSSG